MFAMEISFDRNSFQNYFFKNDYISVTNMSDQSYTIRTAGNRTIIVAGDLYLLDHQTASCGEIAQAIVNQEIDESKYYGQFFWVMIEDERITICCDPFGQYPVLHTKLSAGTYLFASQDYYATKMENVFLPNISYIQQYIECGSVHGCETAAKNVKWLEPGYIYMLKKHGLFSQAYIMDELIKKSKRQNVYDALYQAVSDKIRPYDDIVLDLSGGVESTTLAYILSHFKYKKRIRFITYYEKNSHASNEVQHADKVARFFDIEHIAVEINRNFAFSPYSGSLPFHTFTGTYATLFAQQRYIYKNFPKETLFINGHGGDSLFLASPLNGIYVEPLLQAKFRKSLSVFYSNILMDRGTVCSELLGTIRNMSGFRHLKSSLYRVSQERLNPILSPGRYLQWYFMASTIQETLPMLNVDLTKKNTFFPFLSAPVVIHALSSNIDEFYYKEYNRYSLRKNIYKRSFFKGIWRTDKGDTTHNMLIGVRTHYNYIREYLMNGLLSKNNLVKKDELEYALMQAETGFPEMLPHIVRLYSSEACLRSFVKG